MTRSYGQYCGLARALDVVGDRWNLLLVRELLLGPARFGRLAEGLPGLASNLLTERLRSLETAGVVERRLAGEGNAIVYALTPWGEQLRPTVDSLVRWSAPLMAKGPDGDRFRPEWLAVALPALLAGRTARRATVVAIDVGGPTILVRLTRRGVEVRITGDAGGPIGGGAAGAVDDGIEPDATITTDAATILGLAAGAVTLAQVASAIDIAGNREAVRALFEAKAAETESRPAGAP